MAVARVVEFDGVSPDRVAELRAQLETGEQPEGMNAQEIVFLHDADAEKSLVIVFFENDEEYSRGDAVLSAMPADEVPGRRASVTKYDVAARRSA